MILQQKIFEKLKASRKAKSKPVHFQQMHEKTHEMRKKVSTENRIRKARQNQVPFQVLHENTPQLSAKISAENRNRYEDRYEIIIRIVFRS